LLRSRFYVWITCPVRWPWVRQLVVVDSALLTTEGAGGMDWMTFVVKLVEFGAWPAIAAGILYKTWGSIGPLASKLSKLASAKYKDFELKFDQGIQEVKETLQVPSGGGPYVLKAETGYYEMKGQEATLSTGTLTPQISNDLRSQLVRMADTAPRAAILEAWLRVEHAAEKLIQTKQTEQGVEQRSRGMVGPAVLLRYLEKLSAVTPEQVESFQKLRKLRNDVVHTVDVSLPFDTVIEYIDLALTLAAQLDDAMK